MGVLESIKSMAEGALWLVRWGGLRHHLIRVEQRVAELERLIQEMAREPGDLRRFERKVYSQNGEDGIIEEILRRIGVTNRFFVEFGAQEGLECNCARLARDEQWSGLFMELADDRFRGLQRNYHDKPTIQCVQTKVTSQNIEQLLADNKVPTEFDLLSIDIDSNDYWVWQAICNWKPRMVVVEYNAHFRPPVRWVMKENPEHAWDGTMYFGASLQSFANLATAKGYRLVGTDSRGVNAFFVRDDCADGKFLDRSVAYHYSAPRFGMHELGHPAGTGPFVEL